MARFVFHLSTSGSLETLREKERERGFRKKNGGCVCNIYTLSAEALFSVCKFRMLTDILFIYLSCQHLVQSGVKTSESGNTSIVILYTSIKVNYFECQDRGHSYYSVVTETR